MPARFAAALISANSPAVPFETATFLDPVTIAGGTINDADGTDITAPSVTLDGNVAPGASPGILNIAGNCAFAAADTFSVEIGGTTPGTAASNHDQLDVTGTVTIGADTTLAVSKFNNFTPAGGETFTIIDNDSNDAIVGTFKDRPEAHEFSNFLGSGLNATLSYTGGSGNDAVITVALTATNPSVTLAVNNANIAEAVGVATFTATLSEASGLPVTIDLGFTGSATLTDDYTRSGTQIVMAAGNLSGTATVTAVQDALEEINETVIVDITSVTNGTESGTQQATTTITDDDGIAPVLQSFARQTPVPEQTGADTLVFRATFNEDVLNVDANDFSPTGTTATISNINAIDARTYDITVSGGNLAGFDGIVGLDLAGGQNIVDLFNNALPAGEPPIDETYVVSNATTTITRIGTVETSSETNTTTETIASYTVAAGNERVLIVTTGGLSDTRSVRFDGQPLTRGTGDATASIWYLTLGSGDAISGEIVATFATQHEEKQIAAIAFAGVDQQSPVGASAVETFVDSEPPTDQSITLATQTGQLVVDVLYVNPNAAGVLSATLPQDEQVNNGSVFVDFVDFGVSTKAATGTATTTSWTHPTAGFFFSKHAALPLIPTIPNDAPVLGGLGDVSFDVDSVSAPQPIDADVTLTDADSASLNGGSLTVTYAAAGLSEDQLSIIDESDDITWNFTYQDIVDGSGFGWDDPALGTSRINTLGAAVDIINAVLDHDGTVDFDWETSLNDPTISTLASAGSLFFQNQGVGTGLVFQHATTGVDPTGAAGDGTGRFNFGQPFNSDTDLPSASEKDFLSVGLHELGHALGFAALTNADGSPGITGTRSTFATFLSGPGGAISDEDGVFVGVVSDLTSDALFFTGANAVAAFGGNVPIFAPNPFDPGSSLSHIDSSIPAVMNPTISLAETTRNFAPFEVAIFKDLGYTIATGITLAGDTVFFNGNAFGTIVSDGQNGNDLVVSFFADSATPAAVDALIEALAYQNTAAGVTTARRTIDVTVEDGGGFTNTVAQASADITLTSASPAVTLSVNNATIAEAAGMATITATLAAVSTQAVTVNLGFTGTGTVTDDFTRSGTQIVIAAGDTTGTVTVTAAQDALDESNETVIVDITGVTNGTESGTQQATTTITDDDDPPSVTLSVNNANIAEAAGVATFTATLSAASGQDVTVDLGFTGTATLTGDYTRSGTQIVIAAGSTSGTATVTAVQDAIVETNETVVVDITGVTNGTENGTQQQTTTITDDDDDAPTVTLAVNNATIAEAAGVATFTATLSAASGQDVTVDLGFTGTATLTSDYTRSGTQIVIDRKSVV